MFRVYVNGAPIKWEYKTRKEANEWVKRTKRVNEGLRQAYGANVAPVSTYKVKEEA